jgi:cell division protein FtsQ
VTLSRRVVFALAAVPVAALAWLGWGWFRDSSLVSVRHVQVSGVSSGPDAAAIRHDLQDAARGMTTLDVDRHKLERAVSAYSIVESVSASAKFPSKLVVRVHERVPVVVLASQDGHSVPIAADGTLLPRVPKTKLPTVAVSTAPAHDGFESFRVRALVDVLSNVPDALRPHLQRAYVDPDRGILVTMRDGTELEFGTSARVEAKWASATRVLAAPSATGASRIDVRLPERPAASGFGGQQQAQVGAQNPQG